MKVRLDEEANKKRVIMEILQLELLTKKISNLSSLDLKGSTVLIRYKGTHSLCNGLVRKSR